MNRLVLLGNGFDLAHGMKTTYNDFILWYLRKCFSATHHTDSIIDVKYVRTVFLERGKNLEQLIQHLYYTNQINILFECLPIPSEYVWDGKNPFEVIFKSGFAKELFLKCSYSNWVDIENEYYTELKRIFENHSPEEKQIKINELNETLECIIANLQDYLSNVEPDSHNYEYADIFKAPYLEEEFVDSKSIINKTIEQTLILNFNYTATVEDYLDRVSNIKVNYIHGRLKYHTNPLIFGFGDELDEAYKKIESDKIKGFLKFFKSFWYFKTINYHNLIRYIESSQYQVYIIGHSCGLSDRTMLNMIFEHPNCKSIKVFYHQINQMNNNYTDLTEEISRHFRDKIDMRNKIVPFPLCSPMPQV